jgi:MSHA biogenesis protein MshQ
VAALSGVKVIDATQSEVGVFRVGVTPPVYLGAALGSTNSLSPETYFSTSSPRFIPHHFDASVVNSGRWQPSAPSGNTYVGEPLFWSDQPVIQVSARNSSGAVTRNYTEGDYLKLTSADVLTGMTAPLADRTNLDRSGSPLALSADTNFVEGELVTVGPGVMEYTFSVLDQLVYTRNAQSEVAPYNPDIEIVFDNLATPVSDGEADLANSLSVMPDGSSVDMRFGRLRLSDSFGPENENLTIPLTIEYYDGAGYEVNTVDNDSIWDNSNASINTLSSIVAGGGTFTGGHSGASGVHLLAPTLVPGIPDTGTALINYDAPSWLEGDFDNDGVFDNDPSATATFGVYRGHERVIFRREVR